MAYRDVWEEVPQSVSQHAQRTPEVCVSDIATTCQIRLAIQPVSGAAGGPRKDVTDPAVEQDKYDGGTLRLIGARRRVADASGAPFIR